MARFAGLRPVQWSRRHGRISTTPSSPIIKKKPIEQTRLTFLLRRFSQIQGPQRTPAKNVATNTTTLAGQTLVISIMVGTFRASLNTAQMSSIKMPAHPAANKPTRTAVSNRRTNGGIIWLGGRFRRRRGLSGSFYGQHTTLPAFPFGMASGSARPSTLTRSRQPANLVQGFILD